MEDYIGRDFRIWLLAISVGWLDVQARVLEVLE